MKIMLSAFLKAVVTYLLSLIAFVIAVIFSVMIEPINYIKKHISKKRENKDISKLEI